MAYKIVVDAGHGGCAVRKEEKRISEPPETAQTGNRSENILSPGPLEVTAETGRGRTVSFTVEREFSEQPARQVLERIAGLLLEQWNGSDREEDRKK